MGLPPGARRQLASPRVLQWSASGRIAPRPSSLKCLRFMRPLFILAWVIASGALLGHGAAAGADEVNSANSNNPLMIELITEATTINNFVDLGAPGPSLGIRTRLATRCSERTIRKSRWAKRMVTTP